MADESPDKPVLPNLSPDEWARAKFLDDFKIQMRSPRFRRWLWHLLEFNGWCQVHAVESARLDGPPLFRALGKRELGLDLIQVALAEAPELYMLMLTESRNLKLQRELREDAVKRG